MKFVFKTVSRDQTKQNATDTDKKVGNKVDAALADKNLTARRPTTTSRTETVK